VEVVTERERLELVMGVCIWLAVFVKALELLL
jgi:hypothetical protein